MTSFFLLKKQLKQGFSFLIAIYLQCDVNMEYHAYVFSRHLQVDVYILRSLLICVINVRGNE